MTEEEWVRGIKLETIFTPYARRQRDDMRNRHNPKGTEDDNAILRFAHYTSAESALNIIRTKCLWMRNAMAMSDYQEVAHGMRIVRKIVESQNFREFMEAVEACSPGAGAAGLELFRQWEAAIHMRTFITSVSEHREEEGEHGRLSMWRAFGGQARVALVLEVPWKSGVGFALNVFVSPVAYITESEAIGVLVEVVQKVRQEAEFLRGLSKEIVQGWVFQMLRAAATCLKHEGFKEELEWRAIYSNLHASHLMESSVEVIAGIPQQICKIPLDVRKDAALAAFDLCAILKRVIIGPTQYPFVMQSAIAEEMANIGISDPYEKIVMSGIPLRS